MSICSLADKSRMSTGVSPLTERTAGSGISTRANQQSGTGTPLPFRRPVQSVGVWIRVRVPVSVQSRPCLGCNLIDKRGRRPRKQKTQQSSQLSFTAGLDPLTVWRNSREASLAMADAFHILHAPKQRQKNRLSSMARSRVAAAASSRPRPANERASALPSPGGLGDTH